MEQAAEKARSEFKWEAVDPIRLERYLLGANDPDLADFDGRTFLHHAAKAGAAGCVRMLLRNGADPLKLDRWGLLPAHLAEEAGSLDTLRVFVEEFGLSPDMSNGNGWSLLHSASERGHLETVRWLLFRGARPIVCNEAGSTPLHYACSGRALPVVQFLVEGGHIPVNYANPVGWTPLHYAADGGSLSVVEWMCFHGANAQAVEANGETPLEVAVRKGFADVAEFLLKHTTRS